MRSLCGTCLLLSGSNMQVLVDHHVCIRLSCLAFVVSKPNTLAVLTSLLATIHGMFETAVTLCGDAMGCFWS